MAISEERLKKRLEIRRDQASAKDVLMTKLRAKIQAGYVPKDPREFADILRLVTDYAKHVGYEEECREILEKLSEKNPMGMEKLGVECNGNHNPTQLYMEKKASGDIQCRFCGAKFTDLNIQDKTSINEEIKGARRDGRDTIEKMLNL